MSKKNTFIDSAEEHNRVLARLGILNDDDDWELFKKQHHQQMQDEPDVETYSKYVNHLKNRTKENNMAERLKTKVTVGDFCNGVGAWSLTDQFDVTELLKSQEATISKLQRQVESFHRLINTNTDRKITMEDRFFSLEGDDFILDNNFDFDAGLHVSGDFVDDEKSQYAQMIVTALNKVAAEDRDEEQRELLQSLEDTESPQIRKLKETIEEQKRTIIALNDCVGGPGSCTTDNLVRVGRLEHQIEFLTKRNEILSMALNEAIDGMGGSYAIWAPKAKAALDQNNENQ